MDTNPFSELPPDSVIFGKSSPMLELQEKMRRVLSTNLPVLLQGESGTGKRIISQFIHKHSTRIAGPYIRVSCANDCGTLLDSFPFTIVPNDGQSNSTSLPSVLDFSAIGTLFLEDVGELSPKSQLKLFHALPDGQDCATINQTNPWTTARIICATARNLRQEVNEKRFRRDLFHRLAVVTFEIPPLRDRIDDLLIIAEHLRQHYSESFGLPQKPFPDHLVQRMHYHEWPGNICELENFVCRYVILGADERALRELGPNGDPAAMPGASAPETLLKDVTRRTLANVEREMIMKALNQNQGNLKRAAHALGISYRTLMNKMDQVGLPRARHATKSRESSES